MKTNAKCESLGQNICQRMNITPKVTEESERWRWGRGGGGGALESRKNFMERTESKLVRGGAAGGLAGFIDSMKEVAEWT